MDTACMPPLFITSPSAILFSWPFRTWLCEYWPGGPVDRWRWSLPLIPDWIGEELCHSAVPKRKSRHHYCLEENVCHEKSGWIMSNNKCQNLFFLGQSMWIFPFEPLKHIFSFWSALQLNITYILFLFFTCHSLPSNGTSLCGSMRWRDIWMQIKEDIKYIL